MSNTYFQFKQFTIRQEGCAMKVGTDGVLLGAWAPVSGAKRILDVGTGTGLIALQLAQRTDDAYITAIEVDTLAAAQARCNVEASPWKERVEVLCENFRMFHSDKKYDLIVSNPPYFVNALKCPDAQRDMARHAGDLNYDVLFRQSALLLRSGGRISIIIPAEVERIVVETAWLHGFSPAALLRVLTKPSKPCRRVLLTFEQGLCPCVEQTLCVEHQNGCYTDEYKSLTEGFYLNI